MKRHRNGHISGDHDTAMKLWADELDSIDASDLPRKKFRDIWLSSEMKDEPAVVRAPSPYEPSSPVQESWAVDESTSVLTSPEPELLYHPSTPTAQELPITPVFTSPPASSLTDTLFALGNDDELVEDLKVLDGFDSGSRDDLVLFNEDQDHSGSTESTTSEGSVAEVTLFHESEPIARLKSVKTCIACDEALPLLERVECPCTHFYCFSCIGDFVKVSMQDEAHFPARCCGQIIPRATIKPALSTEVWSQYLAKTSEFGTRIRLYCHSCHAFVPSTRIQNEIGQCMKCGNQTCVHCKKQEHQHECPKDDVTATFLRFAETQDWQRCPSCRAIVEKQFGCQHMSCNCGTEFCYGCGKPWQMCRAWCMSHRERANRQPRVFTTNRGTDGGTDPMDEPRPTPFITGPLLDLTTHQASDVAGTSAAASGIDAIKIKDEPSENDE
ncbi:hypothetical protein NLU13_8968 [Sarocladium strictum]|uniref:RBR-type E3 ubiquitin transferase n=1 Tax=Sarocladium strictum TaxID=5046 RepID=A0AA39GBH3_SARSR|nr:hypothetical protein NLU13_8968 [Sarocladium strictum]